MNATDDFEVYRQELLEDESTVDEFAGTIELPLSHGNPVHCDLEIDGVIYKPQL